MKKEHLEEITLVANNGNTVEELSEGAYLALYDHYCNNGEMPYGTQKARNGDPDEWLNERFHEWKTAPEDVDFDDTDEGQRYSDPSYASYDEYLAKRALWESFQR